MGRVYWMMKHPESAYCTTVNVAPNKVRQFEKNAPKRHNKTTIYMEYSRYCTKKEGSHLPSAPPKARRFSINNHRKR